MYREPHQPIQSPCLLSAGSRLCLIGIPGLGDIIGSASSRNQAGLGARRSGQMPVLHRGTAHPGAEGRTADRRLELELSSRRFKLTRLGLRVWEAALHSLHWQPRRFLSYSEGPQQVEEGLYPQAEHCQPTSPCARRS